MASKFSRQLYHLTDAFPYEIRQQIFREAVVCPEPIHLNRLISEPHRGIARHPFFILGHRTTTALLQTCSQIREEAERMFWEENTFHYTMRPDGQASIHDLLTDLPKIKHLKVDFSVANYLIRKLNGLGHPTHDKICASFALPSDPWVITTNLTRELELIAQHATDLQTLDLHLVSTVCCYGCNYADYLLNVLNKPVFPDESLMEVFALLRGKIRDRFSLTTYSYQQGYFNYRWKFAPCEEWAAEKFEEWPGLKLEAMEKGCMAKEYHAIGKWAIYRWSCWPEGSMLKAKDTKEKEVREGQKKDEEELEKAGCWAWKELGLEIALGICYGKSKGGP